MAVDAEKLVKAVGEVQQLLQARANATVVKEELDSEEPVALEGASSTKP